MGVCCNGQQLLGSAPHGQQAPLAAALANQHSPTHMGGLGQLCAEQLLPAFASGCQTHSALSLNALPGHSGAAQQKG